MLYRRLIVFDDVRKQLVYSQDGAIFCITVLAYFRVGHLTFTQYAFITQVNDEQAYSANSLG